jgi:hypothetical protein
MNEISASLPVPKVEILPRAGERATDSEITCNDVLSGRGGILSNTNGNIQFRKIVSHHLSEYLDATLKMERKHIAAKTVAIVRLLRPPGRFLMKNKTTGYWEEIGDEMARDKASQLLRDLKKKNFPTHPHSKNDQQFVKVHREESSMCGIQNIEIDSMHPACLQIVLPGYGGEVEDSEINCNDVLSGRGGIVDNFEGNIQFRKIASQHMAKYFDRSSEIKRKHLSALVVAIIRCMSPPGRFLMKNKKTGYWEEIGDEKAREKTSQAFRNAKKKKKLK